MKGKKGKMARAYFNEIDPYAAAWLRELIKEGHIAPGDVDERSITDVRPEDLKGYTQCHFFAGIGGWSYALRLAGWPDDRPVWTGSCPCQPFSAAGEQKGIADDRHLWPDFFRLIKACQPSPVWGEQVASTEVVGTELEASFLVAVRRGDFAAANKLAKRLATSRSFHFHRRWIDGVCADLESADYTVRFEVLGAHSVNAPHIRQRLFWVADAAGGRRGEQRGAVVAGRCGHTNGSCTAGGLADAELQRAGSGEPGVQGHPRIGRDRPAIDGEAGIGGMEFTDRDGRPGQRVQNGWTPEAAGTGETGGVRLGDTIGAGLERHAGNGDDGSQPGRIDPQSGGSVAAAGGDGAWSRFDILPFRDGKFRRVEAGTFPLAHGIPARVGRLRGYGNAIVPQVAQAFIQAYLDALSA